MSPCRQMCSTRKDFPVRTSIYPRFALPKVEFAIYYMIES